MTDRAIPQHPVSGSQSPVSAIRLRGLEHVQRQRRAELAAVNHVLGARELRARLSPKVETQKQGECCKQVFFHLVIQEIPGSAGETPRPDISQPW